MNRIARAVTAIAVAALAAVVTVGSGTAGAGSEHDRGRGHYATVNGMRMYYEVHGQRNGQPPVVLIHGAFSATGTSWSDLVRPLSRTRQVISVEQQGHGHTEDTDRPLRMTHMADDTAALLDRIGVGRADVWGYSMGAGVALQMGIDHPEKVRKLVLQSAAIHNDAYYPGQLELMEQMTPEMLYGSPFHQEYMDVAPNPEDFDALVAKVRDMVRTTVAVPPADVQELEAPVLTIMSDSDIFQPEHAVELFRLTGGGVNGDISGLPESQLAVLPGASHVSGVHQARLLLTMVPSFLDS